MTGIQHADTSPIDDDAAYPPCHLDKGPEQVRIADSANVSTPLLPDEPVEIPIHLALGGKPLDNTDAGHILMDKGIEIRILLSEEAPAPVCPTLDKNQAHGKKWYDEEGEESQLDIENQHDHAHADKLDKVGEQCENALIEQLF